MRVTVLFDNLGPYHLARLSAAASVCEVTALELNANSVDYEWQTADLPTSIARRTVFSPNDKSEKTPGERLAALNLALEETKPDVVAIPGWSGWHAFVAADWCLKSSVPIVVMSESTAIDEPRSWWKESVKRRFVSLCAAALVGGERHAQYLLQLGMPRERIFFGYDVVDNQYFADESARVRGSAEFWRQCLKLPERYFLASARFIEKKNLRRLLRAFAEYRAAISTEPSATATQLWDLVLLGDGPLRTQLLTIREELGLASCVHFPGLRQYGAIPAYYALAEAFIHASIEEPWGLVVNEAMACGLPVLVSNRCGCAPSLVCDGENGRTFDPTDCDAIANCLVEIARSSGDQRQQMGCCSSEIIAGFGSERFAIGLRSATAAALSAQTTKPRVFDRLVLRSLVWKSARKRPQKRAGIISEPVSTRPLVVDR
jgi:1,2-diacylglycerol 3-alpha-glucosyltransferase